MIHLKKFNESIQEDTVTLTKDEKSFIWSKIEYTKKKKAEQNKTEIFDALNSDGDTEIDRQLFINILNSLEYTFKKQLTDTEKVFKNKTAESIKSKLPTDWFGVKYSLISRKK